MSKKFHSPYQFIPVDTVSTQTHTWEKNDDLKNLNNPYIRRDLKNLNNPYIRHDFWYEESHSGRIHCTLKCLSPLIVANRQVPGSKESPRKIEQYELPEHKINSEAEKHHAQKRYAIPGNSLRGMIASVIEVISQSAMRVLNDEAITTYSVRKTTNEALSKIGIIHKYGAEYRVIELTNHINIDIYEGTVNYWCKKDRKKKKRQSNPKPENVRVINLQTTFQNNNNRTFFKLQEGILKSCDDESGKIAQEDELRGVLYIRARDASDASDFPGKVRETFIPWPTCIDDAIQRGEGILVARGVKERTEEMLKECIKNEGTSVLPKGYESREQSSLIQSGDLIYFRENNGKVTELSYSAIWRRAVPGTLHGAFKRSAGINSLPWNAQRTELTPAEALLGVVEDQPRSDTPARNLASRVRFNDDIADASTDLTKETILKILDAPKPPSPAMYFSASSNRKVSKSELSLLQSRHKPNGRKWYLPHQANADEPWATQRSDILKACERRAKNVNSDNDSDENVNLTQFTRCRLVEQGGVFRFHIDYENLSAEELGLLLRALQPHEESNEASGFIHRIGTGKPIGLGQVCLSIDKVEHLERNNRYHDIDFNTQRYCEHKQDIASLFEDSLVDKKALQTLQTVSNRQYLDGEADVCYPFSGNIQRDEDREKEGFKWFVNNDNQFLEKVTPGKTLPILNSSSQKHLKR